jgi:hypothetical protein
VFTTHGPFVARRLRPGGSDYGLSNELARTLTNGYEQDGFGYVDYPAEVLNAIGMKKYGFSVSRPSWVCRQIESLPGSRIITYTERAWDNHQDSVACTNQ